MASFTGEPKGRGLTSLCLLHSTTTAPLPSLDLRLTKFPFGMPLPHRAKDQEGGLPPPAPGLSQACGIYRERLRLQKPSPAPPLPLPPVLLWCQSSLKPEKLLIFSLTDLSLLRAKRLSSSLSPCVKERAVALFSQQLCPLTDLPAVLLFPPLDLGSRTRYEGSPKSFRPEVRVNPALSHLPSKNWV